MPSPALWPNREGRDNRPEKPSRRGGGKPRATILSSESGSSRSFPKSLCLLFIVLRLTSAVSAQVWQRYPPRQQEMAATFARFPRAQIKEVKAGRWGHRRHHPHRRGQIPERVRSWVAQSAALSAARWAADRARSLAQQLALRPAPLSPRKRKRGLADIIGGAAPVITAIRTVPGRRQWARIIAVIELDRLCGSSKACVVATAFIQSRRGSGKSPSPPWMILRSHGECSGAPKAVRMLFA